MAKRGLTPVIPATSDGAKGSGVIGCGNSWLGEGMHDHVDRDHRPIGPYRWLATACLLGVLLAAAGAGPVAHAQASKETSTPETASAGLKVLRYVSLKSDRVFLRKGPGTDYPIAWVFQRAGLPVEVLREFEVWRQVRDASGTVGWVHGSLLSSRRTALILPWEVKEGKSQAPLATLRDDGHERARAVAQVEAGVLVSIISCANRWCRVSIGDHRGYIEQAKLWGTYPNEQIR
jgi:SH3-like domain-containing protein